LKKLKAVWICHFSNQEVLQWIKPWFKRKEISQGLSNFIKGFYDRKDIELHVISLHSGISFYKKHLDKGITYHFVNYGIPLLGIPWQPFFPLDILTNYFLNKRIIRMLINRIKPDIINLFGAENPNYSSTVLQFRKTYPVLITIQGYVSLSSGFNNFKEKKRVEVEQKILRKFQNFAGEEESKVFLSTLNNNFNFYKFYYPVNEELVDKIKVVDYKYDILFYGRIVRDKGIEDFIKITGVLKKTFPNIKALIIGGYQTNYFKELKDLVIQYNCGENIHFSGFLNSQELVYNFVKASKILLVPTYNDRLPSTIREAMMLKTAVIAYKTGGIPNINKQRENIKLVDVGDLISMKESIIKLLNNEGYRLKIIENAYKYAKSEFSLEKNVNTLVEAYDKILNQVK
jgi:glycosyltransferase involved in cell wall biosynthesis